MRLGLYLRNMGPASTRETMSACARAADAAGIDDLWLADHIAIPPDDAEGSGGRYLDPLASLAYLAGITARVGLGTGVLVLPYRPPLATAKWVATIQELSGGRMLLGVGVGWMQAEFTATGANHARRGAVSDETLAFIHRCFSGDEVEANGQRFLFRPRPERPPIFVGGAAPHALARTVRCGEGWMPMGADASVLAGPIAELHRLAEEAGKPEPEVVAIGGLALDDPDACVRQLEGLAGVGVTRFVHGERYTEASEFQRMVDAITERVRPRLSAE